MPEHALRRILERAELAWPRRDHYHRQEFRWCALNHTSNDPIAAHFESSRDALERATRDAALLATVHAIAAAIIGALASGNKLLLNAP
jgi:hypothetical protein